MLSKEHYNKLSEIDRLCINTIRFLSVDGIQKANSGHPGLPMGMAPLIYQLYTKHLRHNPKNPDWINRDRFVMSAGHGSMLLYSILHLTGYDVSLDDLKNFRQSGSKTPGHPEYGHTAGVEMTTGPLGQGLSSAVGLAIAEKYAASYFNKPGFPMVDNRIYTLAGDGCLQEGIASESSSLAGHLGLDNLIVIYDDNKITIDGDTKLSFTEDVLRRYEAYNWHVQEIRGDGHDLPSINEALTNAQNHKGQPSLIKVQSVIGFGSPNKQGSSSAHGSPLGEEEIKLTRESLGWNFETPFHVPSAVSNSFQPTLEKGKALEKSWTTLFDAYEQEFPQLAKEFGEALDKRLPEKVKNLSPAFEPGKAVATRSASGQILNSFMPDMPLMMGGSADLSPSNNTHFKAAESFQKELPSGRYLHFGVREHAMGAILNGISLNGLVRAYGATFLCFADYMLPSIRVASLSGYPSIFVFTHDSIGLGEDGPTHQPVEHISYLRAMPGLISFRPADANETAFAWKFALQYQKGPVSFALTRQGLPTLDQDVYGKANQVEKGAYVLVRQDNPDLLIIGTGSEVSLAIEAAGMLKKEGINAQIISMPSAELFEQQSDQYKRSVLPEHVKARVAVEAGIKGAWDTYLGDNGVFVGMDGFGASAPANELFQKFNITTDAVLKAAKKSLLK
ncbi:MAG: transketolase [Proteobacteria bacterium]|nr:transketolase [Pseudomonadota bacterium]